MNSRATISLRKSAGTPDNGVSSQNAAGTPRILIKIIKNSGICDISSVCGCVVGLELCACVQTATAVQQAAGSRTAPPAQQPSQSACVLATIKLFPATLS